MCVVSNVGDYYKDYWTPRFPQVTSTGTIILPEVTKEEFEKLKAEVQEMKWLLEKAIEFDKKNKVAFLKQVAEFVGVDLEEVFGKLPKKKKK